MALDFGVVLMLLSCSHAFNPSALDKMQD